MRDIWYSDNRDLVKWSVILHIAKQYGLDHVLQIAYYRDSEFGTISIDGNEHEIPDEVLAHFRNINNIQAISGHIKVSVFNSPFDDRAEYASKVSSYIKGHNSFPVIVFLDPDTGLEHNNPNMNHVLDSEANEIWGNMKAGDIFVFYQHQTNRNGQPWIEPKREQLAAALGIVPEGVKVAHSTNIARDVAFYYATKV